MKTGLAFFLLVFSGGVQASISPPLGWIFLHPVSWVPAFWVFSDPVSTYKAAIAINALLASSVIVPLFFILTSLFRVPDRSARWIAFTCCLYPPLVFHSSFAWS